MTLDEARARLAPLHLEAGDIKPRGCDLEISHPGDGPSWREEGWTFREVSAVAAALGVVDIDIASVVVEYAEGLKLERKGSGCPSCGHGDVLLVRGILDPSEAPP